MASVLNCRPCRSLHQFNRDVYNPPAQQYGATFSGLIAPEILTSSTKNSNGQARQIFPSRSSFETKRPMKLSVTCAAVGNVISEPATGIQFPDSIIAPGSTSTQTLLGAGVREKKIAIINVKVYALAFYADPTLKDSLPAKGEGDAALFKAIAGAPVEKTFVIVLARDVEGSQFWSALDEALAPRLKAMQAWEEGEKALASFGEVFKNRALKKNTGLFLTFKKEDTLQISITEDATTLKPPTEVSATIVSSPLLQAFFDVYLGSTPVSASTKSSIALGAYQL